VPFRFRRLLNILPRVKLNLSKGGVGRSMGREGFHDQNVNVRRRLAAVGALLLIAQNTSL
jgi:hypothetical protein